MLAILCQLQSMNRTAQVLTGRTTRNVCIKCATFPDTRIPFKLLLRKADTRFQATRNVCIVHGCNRALIDLHQMVTFRRLCISSEINRWPDHNSVIRSRQISKAASCKRTQNVNLNAWLPFWLYALRYKAGCELLKYNIRTLCQIFPRWRNEGLVLV